VSFEGDEGAGESHPALSGGGFTPRRGYAGLEPEERLRMYKLVFVIAVGILSQCASATSMGTVGGQSSLHAAEKQLLFSPLMIGVVTR
jgi:hypothetical protein